jgi:hypothetical protein
MLFKPIDEMSLRHLFSSQYSEQNLGLSYIGPVLSAASTIETSPDCLILDKRTEPWRILRCEFKFEPSRKEDFDKNGLFEIAIVWAVRGIDRHVLENQLRTQNGCDRLIALSDYKAFRDLPEYSYSIPAQVFNQIDNLREVILRLENYPTVVAAWVSAKIYPEAFQLYKLVEALTKRFPEVRRMHPKGRANVVTKLLQTKTPLIKFMHGKTYLWNDSINPKMAVAEIEQLIRSRYSGKDIPSSDILDEIRSC